MRHVGLQNGQRQHQKHRLHRQKRHIADASVPLEGVVMPLEQHIGDQVAHGKQQQIPRPPHQQIHGGNVGDAVEAGIVVHQHQIHGHFRQHHGGQGNDIVEEALDQRPAPHQHDHKQLDSVGQQQPQGRNIRDHIAGEHIAEKAPQRDQRHAEPGTLCINELCEKVRRQKVLGQDGENVHQNDIHMMLSFHPISDLLSHISPWL